MSLVGTSRLFAAMRRHCEQRNDEAIHSYVIARQDGLLRFARNDEATALAAFPFAR